MDWKTIDTAPRNGTRVLLYAPGEYWPVCEAWYARPYDTAPVEDGWWVTLKGKLDSDKPKAWAPMPAAPV